MSWTAFSLGVVTGFFLFPIAVVVLVAALGTREREPEGTADPAWQPSGYRYTCEGFDPALRERTAVKRAREERMRRAAARVVTRPAGEAPIRPIGGVN